jgi:hypothetical protein
VPSFQVRSALAQWAAFCPSRRTVCWPKRVSPLVSLPAPVEWVAQACPGSGLAQAVEASESSC